MCLSVPSSAVACTNPLASPKAQPYSLAMVHSSEANAGYLLNPPKPRRRRRASDGSPIAHSPSETVPHASAIGYKSGVAPPSLRAITKSTKKRVERFDYAKALLRSDEELEKLSFRIRKEINESELFELALAAERAADAGEEKFAGRASTFGGEQQHNHHKYLSSLGSGKGSGGKTTERNCKNESNNISTRTYSTMSTTTVGSSSSYMAGSSDFITSGMPTIGITPATPDKRGLLLDKTKYPSSPGLLMSPSERSLLETMVDIASHAPEEPDKRSMGVESLRDVNEVIPNWKELHGHMRSHLFQESVEKRTLIFHPKQRNEEKSSSNIFIKPLADDITGTPKHRRSRSFLESFADMAVPHFGGTPEQKRREQIRSTGSFDFMSIMSTDDNPTNPIDSDIESSSSKDDTLRTNGCGGNKLDPPASLAVPSFENFKLDIKSTTPHPPKNRSACSSETTSLVSDSSHLEIHDVTENSESALGLTLSDGGNDSVVFAGHVSENCKNPAIPDATAVASPSMADDDSDSVAPPSPGLSASLEMLSSESYQQGPPLQDIHPAVPLTPCDPKIQAVTGFDTPAHLRAIKGIEKSTRLERKLVDAPRQPRLDEKLNGDDVETTPSISFPAPYEPNSIVDTTSDLPRQETRFPERSKSPLEDVETRFLALPTITGSASESSLKKLPSRRIPRRKISRSQWADSPTTPTDQVSRSFLQPVKLSHNDFLPKSTSYMPMNGLSLEQHKHEFKLGMEVVEESGRELLNASTSSDKSNLMPILQTHSDIVDLVSRTPTEQITLSASYDAANIRPSLIEYKEEKKECEDVEAISIPTHQQEQHDDFSTPHRIFLKSMPTPADPYHEENAAVERSFHSTKSAPNNGSPRDEGDDGLVLKRTGTWDGVVSRTDSVDPIGAVNSLISNTSAVVNDAAGFLADTLSGEPKETDESVYDCSVSLKDQEHQSPAKKLISRLGVHPLCHGEENFKAAVQGVLSHLSLSPRSPDREEQEENSKLFFPEPENKEFLRNYFYCTKDRDEKDKSAHDANARNTSIEHSGDVDPMNSSTAATTGFGERIACAAEPCAGTETTCNMIGVDSICSGVSHILFAATSNNLDGSTGTNAGTGRASTRGSFSTGRDVGVVPTPVRTRSASLGQSNAVAPHPAPGTPRDSGIGASPPPLYKHGSGRIIRGSRESWMGMFQRVASERFYGDNELEKSSKHSFTPPNLTRRVLTRNTTK
ncbi:MAG: hypothetical protein SGILL_003124 [Bacillariaceae sp.]